MIDLRERAGGTLRANGRDRKMRGSMPESDAATGDAMLPQGTARAGLAEAGARAGRLEWALLAVFAMLLALVTWRHEMWRDELQAWLIARDSYSLAELLRSLRYEGHPALWYLLLWIPSHISWNPVSMQVIHYVLALGLAWVILSARRLDARVRVLLVFSFFVFYQYGVIARNYGLAMLLLVGAARCVLAERPQRRLAVVLLALAMNTHVLAVPVAIAVFVWMFFFAGDDRRRGGVWRGAITVLRGREFQVASLVLAVGLGASYFTARPAPDLAALDSTHASFGARLLDTVSISWQMFAPYLPSHVARLIAPLYAPSFAACAFSFAVFGLATLVLRTMRARVLFAACAMVECVALAATIGWPDVYHFGFVFTAFVIALLMDAGAGEDAGEGWGLWRRAATGVLLAMLGMQVLSALGSSVLDILRPYSGAKEVSRWLKRNHLERNPLVLEPSEFTTAIVGYLEQPSAYYPSCQCFGSYEIRNTRRDLGRMASRGDLKTARGDSPLPVILIANERLKPTDAARLALVEIHASGPTAILFDERFVVYEQERP